MHHFEYTDAASAAAAAYWPPTATLDWCEENYVACKYIAEFWNSSTNLVFLLLAALGVSASLQYRLPRRYTIAHALTGLVGIGSFLFHATLSYPMQLLDELPMIYCVCVLTYTMFYHDLVPRKRDALLRIVLWLDAFLITVSYVWLKWPIFHQFMFGVHCAAICARGTARIRAMPPSAGKRTLMQLVTISWITDAIGFACWNVDNLLCHSIRATRAGWIEQGTWFGAFLAALLQFHAWWHILTGLGTYTHIIASVWMDVVDAGVEAAWCVRWFGPVPLVVPKDPARVAEDARVFSEERVVAHRRQRWQQWRGKSE